MLSKAMQFEEVPLSKVSNSGVRKEVKRLRDTNINNMSSGAVIWFLVVKHKFELLATFTFVYVAFSLFGTLIVGLIKSI